MQRKCRRAHSIDVIQQFSHTAARKIKLAWSVNTLPTKSKVILHDMITFELYAHNTLAWHNMLMTIIPYVLMCVEMCDGG